MIQKINKEQNLRNINNYISRFVYLNGKLSNHMKIQNRDS